ncbi:MAG: head-tail adaptor protein [Porticoccaceae bacterium]|nr:head-tail adaptor protein [Porticoccaceae bacterium]
MRAGRLRFVCNLQNPAQVGSQYSTSTGYITVAERLRVDIVPQRGTEIRGEHQAGTATTVEIHLRFHPLITSASRLIDVEDNTVYQVIAPINLGRRNRDLRLQCKVVT